MIIKYKNKILIWLVIIFFSLLIYYSYPEFFKKIFICLAIGDIKSLAFYLKSFGNWTLSLLLLLFVVLTFDLFFPFILLEGAVAMIYGVFWGVIISWVGEVSGAIFMFVFARFFFRGKITSWLEKSRYLKQADDYSSQHGFRILFYARVFPLVPTGIITSVAAISKISNRDFLIATTLGKLPPIIIKVVLGYDIINVKENGVKSAIALILIVVFCYIVFLLKKEKTYKGNK